MISSVTSTNGDCLFVSDMANQVSARFNNTQGMPVQHLQSHAEKYSSFRVHIHLPKLVAWCYYVHIKNTGKKLVHCWHLLVLQFSKSSAEF